MYEDKLNLALQTKYRMNYEVSSLSNAFLDSNEEK